MELKSGQYLTQSLQLNVTQDLIQAISLLQYTSLELISVIHEIAESNPLIEVDVHFDLWRASKKKNNRDEPNDWIEKIRGETESNLLDDLREQIIGLPLSAREIAVLNYFFEQIDENGYFDQELEELCEQLQIDHRLAEKMLAQLQELDPPGIGARNLPECLLLQLRRKGEADDVAEKILIDHFADFAERKWNKLSKDTKIPVEQIEKLMAKVRYLNPRPGARYHKGNPAYIVPDVILEYKNDRWHIRLLEDTFFTIKLNEEYKNIEGSLDSRAKEFYQQNYQHYQWLKNSIEKRKETIRKIVRKIIEYQGDFFLKKEPSLKPMTMQALAEEMAVHPSTVSRVSKNKYIRTPRGTFAFKDLFTAQFPSVHGGEVSVHEIKRRIEEIIAGENKKAPYSDQKIADMLKKEGITASRRVIAKYREQMKIPSSTIRKRIGMD